MIPVRKTDVQLGKPLPFPLFDSGKQLLLPAGVILQTVEQVDALSARGLYREPAANSPSHAADAVPDRDGILLDLERIRMQIGDAVQLQPAAEAGQRHTVRLLGHATGRSVMVSAPTVGEGYVLVKPGTAYVVRFFSGKSVYAFPATVLKMSSTPFPYLHLTYPPKVRGMKVRRAQRASIRLIASLTDMYGATHAGSLIDISKGGALFSCRDALGAQGDEIQLKFRLKFDDIDQFVSVRALIRSVQPAQEANGAASMVNHGLEFSEVPESDRLALTAFVYQKLIEASEVA
ncbi:flagellar brake protein [Methyloversatilis thermotolerans]|uniref:flagellar brake protein n=1 Tax=Methyloversatilis thermotolerans TaxID=1346290 RepID=UPI00036B0893|nr:flagellar brake protein [Methyloversatilis thermotolerans]